jgi:hypothetical protein
MFLLQYKDKQFLCGQDILTEGAFASQLRSNVRTSVGRIVWGFAISGVICVVTAYCRHEWNATKCKDAYVYIFQVDEDDVFLSSDIPSLVEDFLKVGLKKHNAVSMGLQT